jgi:hypothetical protein
VPFTLLTGGLSDRPGTVPRMGRLALFDTAAVANLLGRQNGIITRKQTRTCGMSEAALRYRTREGGPWQVLLPGVYASCTGSATVQQRNTAAVLYAGPRSVITGPAALVSHRLRAPRTQLVDVLVPMERRRHSVGFVRVSRTSRMPGMLFSDGPVTYVPPERAVADTVRGLRDLGEVRAVVADGVQRGTVLVWQLTEELTRGPVQGSARFRRVLEEVADGVRSSAEGDLRALIRRERLPDPMYNPRLYAGDTFIAAPDAWWADAGVAVEVESRQWHLSPGDWERTMARAARMGGHGIVVLHFPPARLKSESRQVGGEIRAALAAGFRRGRLGIRALPAR